MISSNPASWSAETSGSLGCYLASFQVRCFGSPTSGPKLNDVGMVEQAIQHRCHGGVVAEKFAPVFDRSIGGEERAGPLVPAHHQLEEILRRGAGKLAHSEVIDDEQRDFRQQLEVQSSAAIQLRVSKFLQQVVGLPVEDAMTLLLDSRPSDGLSDVTLSRAWGPKEEGVLLFVDEFCGG